MKLCSKCLQFDMLRKLFVYDVRLSDLSPTDIHLDSISFAQRCDTHEHRDADLVRNYLYIYILIYIYTYIYILIYTYTYIQVCYI